MRRASSPHHALRRDFAAFVAVLREEQPTRHPVRAYLRHTEDCFGYTNFDGERFVVVVRAGMSWDMTRDTLIHEWAHALTYDPWKAASHGPYWALVYGRLYQRYIDA